MSDKIQALRDKWMATACGSLKEFDVIVEIVKAVADSHNPPAEVTTTTSHAPAYKPAHKKH